MTKGIPFLTFFAGCFLMGVVNAAAAGLRPGQEFAVGIILLSALMTGLLLTATRRRTQKVSVAQNQTSAQLAEAELALRKSEERFRLAFTASSVGMAVTDPRGRYVQVNPALCQMLGYTEAELLATDCSSVTHPDDRAANKEHVLKVLAGEGPPTYNRERRYLHKDGRVIWGDMTATLVRTAAGEPEYFILQIQDITTSKQAEEALRTNEVHLRETQKLESLGVLAGGIAHDFNNLLTGVLGNASLAREYLPSDSPLHEYLRPIEVSAEHAAQLCQQMLSYAGKGAIIRGTVDLNRVAEESADLLRVSVPRKAELRYVLDSPLPPLTADVGQLRQVLLNLVHNAAEALGGSGGTVTLTTGYGPGPEMPDAVWAGAMPAEPVVWLEVADTGSGIKPEVLKRIFEPFFTTKFTGRGLGLSAVHGIVRSHNGAIAVTSEVGRGTRFRVYLPADQVADPDCDGTLQEVCTRSLANSALVADDEAMIRGMAAVALRAQGLTVIEAENGQEAVDLVLAEPDRYAMVLLDVMMPVLDGREALQMLRAEVPHLPVILMSEYMSDADMPGVEFMPKPFRPADLTALVRRVLSNPRGRLTDADRHTPMEGRAPEEALSDSQSDG